MGAIESRVFKSGNSAALRLPKELGLAVGDDVVIERIGDRIEVRRRGDTADDRRQLVRLAAEIGKIWRDAAPHPDRGRRDPIDFPDRPRL